MSADFMPYELALAGRFINLFLIIFVVRSLYRESPTIALVESWLTRLERPKQCQLIFLAQSTVILQR